MMLLSALAFAQDFRFAVVGDTQTDGNSNSINWQVFPGIVEGANEQDATYLIVAGDLVGGSSSLSSTVAQWEDFKLAAEDFRGEVFMVPGNHDVYGGSGTFDAWRESFPWLPTDDSPVGEEGVSYLLDHGDVRFVFVTSDRPGNTYALSSEGLVWLDRVLSESEDFEHTFVVTHHPVSFSADSGHGGTAGDFWQTLVAYDVTGLFVGHWHRYQPSQLGAGGQTWETILGTGGGWQGFDPIRPYQQIPGFVLVEVSGGEATGTFFTDADGDGNYDDPVDSYSMSTVVPGLKGHWSFEDGTLDLAPTDKHVDGELVGDAYLEDGALVLDGEGDFMEAGAIGDYVLAIHDDLTVSLWTQVLGVSSDTSYGSVLVAYATNDYAYDDEQSNYSYLFSLLPDGRLSAFWEYSEGYNVQLLSTEASPLLDGEWHHLALVREDKRVRFYVDGAALGEEQSFERSPTGGGRGMLYLGSDTRYYDDYDLAGHIDEVRVYNLALGEDAIAELAVSREPEPEDTAPPEDSGTPEDSASDGGPEVPEIATGCGCATSGGGPSAYALLLLALMSLRRASWR